MELHLIFKGRVQGVGFRAAAQYIAEDLSVTGSVKNLDDGTVEVYAQGDKEVLEQFLSKLKSRFRNSQVALEEYKEPEKKCFSFDVIF